ncbi:FtsB family cell division protein [Prosthecobacter dejongeii]|uniref:Cell division protein FtsB n=1 Tax=Prosthecobacter dejongeii TaxID=48465 RepID=A0A7W8DT56_9BACT|nr:septum formation initiator family protein [Prosthecobacter dejongeii]MBB5040536.1 cell division protein FtsB [Prosthecobacter dejongeii]
MEYREFQIEHERPQQMERWLRALVRLGKFCLLLLAVPVVIAIYKKPLAEQNAMRAKLAVMEGQRDALKNERDKLLRQVDWIKTDPNYLEIRARDHENMHKKGEYVIRFVE